MAVSLQKQDPKAFVIPHEEVRGGIAPYIAAACHFASWRVKARQERARKLDKKILNY